MERSKQRDEASRETNRPSANALMVALISRRICGRALRAARPNLVEDHQGPPFSTGNVVCLVPHHLVQVAHVPGVHRVVEAFHMRHVCLDLRVVPHADAPSREWKRSGQAHDDASIDADAVDVQREAAVVRIGKVSGDEGVHALEAQLFRLLPMPFTVLRDEDLVRLLQQRLQRFQQSGVLRRLRVLLLGALCVAADFPVVVVDGAESVGRVGDRVILFASKRHVDESCSRLTGSSGSVLWRRASYC
mmetsp:Transcript_4146/g.16070  ORF Transcript_4146/g.16070 Transcript_4146/m.16070 type:complete len:247 (-) Transcript_4146:236-976(-)